jgi:DNA-binding NarL/FixJ family response regulator
MSTSSTLTCFRELSRLQHTRPITFTGYGQESDRSRARQVGFHHYLVKSVDLHAIDAVLATAKSLGPQASLGQQRYVCGNGLVRRRELARGGLRDVY